MIHFLEREGRRMGDRGMGTGQKHRQRQRETKLGVGIIWTICGMPCSPINGTLGSSGPSWQ